MIAKTSIAASLIAVSLIFSTGYVALGQAQPSETTPAKIGAQDAQFMVKAAQSDMTEIKTSQLAQERGASDSVKQYGQMMITEHTKSTKELTALAGQKEVTLPQELAPKQQALYDKLSKLSGKEFDREYLAGQKMAHAETAAFFQDQLQKGKDEDVKQFATKVLPVVKKHEEVASGLSSGRMTMNEMNQSTQKQ